MKTSTTENYYGLLYEKANLPITIHYSFIIMIETDKYRSWVSHIENKHRHGNIIPHLFR